MTAISNFDLRPLSMGQLLDRGLRLYRNNFLKFIGIVALGQIPVVLVGILIASVTSDPTDLNNLDSGAIFAGGLLGLVGTIITSILTLIANAALTQAVSDTYLGNSFDILGVYRKIGDRWGPLLGALIVAGLYNFLIGLWFIVPCAGWFTGLGMLFYSQTVLIPLIAPIMVLENGKASQSFLRAWNLARRRFWWVLGFMLLLTAFSLVIVSGPTALITYLLQGPLSDTSLMVQNIVNQLTTFVFNLLYLPLQLTCIALLYFDIRVRTEGFDLALLAGKADAATTDDDVIAHSARVQKQDKLMPTYDEFGYFFGLTILFAVLYFGAVFLIVGLTTLSMGL